MLHRLLATAGLTLCATIASAEIKSESIVYYDNETALEGVLVYDAAKTEKRPGVMIVHQWKGTGEHELDVAKRLAEMGYVAFAADIYGQGIRPSDPQEAGKQAGKYKNNRELLRGRVLAGFETMKEQPQVDATKTAAIGYCFGGTTVLELALTGADVDGVVSFHGGFDLPQGYAPAGKPSAEILILHGAVDPHAPVEQLVTYTKMLDQANAKWQVNLYSDAVHSFTEKNARGDSARYDARADRRSWQDMTELLTEIWSEQAAQKPTDSTTAPAATTPARTGSTTN